MSMEPPSVAPLPVGEAIVNPENPWPGLYSYAEHHAPYFHGREAEAVELHRRVRGKTLTVLFGQSGLGKSSLLHAGLFPALRSHGFLPVRLRLVFGPAVPALRMQVLEDLGEALEQALGADFVRPRPTETLWEYLHRADLRLQAGDGEPCIPVLIFDQFEELFTRGHELSDSRNQVLAFMQELADAAEDRPSQTRFAEDGMRFQRGTLRYRVLISLREDFIAHLESYRSLMPSLLENRMRLTPLTGLQAVRAVSRPAHVRAELPLVTPAVCRQIVRFVAGVRRGEGPAGQPGVETWEDVEELTVDSSILNLVCRELNERRQREAAEQNQLGLSQITSGLVEQSGRLESILRKFYAKCMADQPAAVRSFVEDELLTESGFRDNLAVERAHQSLRSHGADPAALSTLVERRLLRIEDRLGQSRVEIAHDVLCGVIAEAAERRHADEQIQRAEAQREEEEKRRRETERTLRRSRILVGAFALLGLIAAAMAFVAFRALKEANRQRVQADEKRAEAARLAVQVRQTRGQVDLELAQSYAEKGSRGLAVAYLCRGLKTGSENPAALRLLCSILRTMEPPQLKERVAGLERKIRNEALKGVAKRLSSYVAVPFVLDHGPAVTFPRTSGREPVTFDERPAVASMPERVRIPATAESVAAGGIPVPDGMKASTFNPDPGRASNEKSDGEDEAEEVQPDALASQLALPMFHRQSADFSALAAHGTERAFYSADGTAIYDTNEDETRRWSAKSGEGLPPDFTQDGYARGARLSQDGRRLLTWQSDGVELRDTSSGETVQSLQGLVASPVDAIWSEECGRILVVGEHGEARVSDAETGKPVNYNFNSSREPYLVRGAAFVPGGRFLVTGSSNNVDTLEDELRREKPGLPVEGVTPPQRDAPPAGSADRLPSPATEGSVQELEKRRRELAVTQFKSWAQGSTAAPAASCLRVWDLQQDLPLGFPLGAEESIRSIVISSDGTRLISVSVDQKAKLWDPRNHREIGTLSTQANGIVQFSEDGSRVAVALDTGVQLYETKIGKPVGDEMASDNTSITAARFSHRGELVVFGTKTGDVLFYDPASARMAGMPLHFDEPISNVCFSPDDSTLLVASADGVHLWDIHDPQGAIPAWFFELAEAAGGQRLGENNANVDAPEKTLGAVREQVLASRETDEFTRFGQWLVQPQLERSLGPFMPARPKEVLKQLLEPDDEDAVRNAAAWLPNSPDVLARAARREKDPKAVREMTRRARKLAPDRAEIAWSAAQALRDMEVDQPIAEKEALAAIDEAIRLDGSKPDYYELRAGLSVGDDDGTRRLADFQAALDRSANKTDLLCSRAGLYLALGQPARAEADFEAALAIKPDDVDVLARYGYGLMKMKQYARAIDLLKKSREHATESNLEDHLALCVAQELSGNRKAALAEFLATFEESPKWTEPKDLAQYDWPEEWKQAAERLRAAAEISAPEMFQRLRQSRASEL